MPPCDIALPEVRAATTIRAAQNVDTKYIRPIQRQIELTLLRAERDATLLDRNLAQVRSTAASALPDAVPASPRPYGFGRRRFLAGIRKAAR